MCFRGGLSGVTGFSYRLPPTRRRRILGSRAGGFECNESHVSCYDTRLVAYAIYTAAFPVFLFKSHGNAHWREAGLGEVAKCFHLSVFLMMGTLRHVARSCHPGRLSDHVGREVSGSLPVHRMCSRGSFSTFCAHAMQSLLLLGAGAGRGPGGGERVAKAPRATPPWHRGWRAATTMAWPWQEMRRRCGMRRQQQQQLRRGRSR